ncbi:adenylosuccinate synthase [Candidatus Peregrinibacteria bacterium]|nr:adenylosuccinate synthase [Candidatus Peregrinibacteria bacterium]
MLSSLGNICVIIGAQWGDEGKGKLVDILSEEFDIIARSAGGANAGHTIYVEGRKFVFHLIPSGLLHKGKVGIIGNGCVVHLPTLFQEIEDLKSYGVSPDGRLFLSDRAHLIFEYHIKIDCIQEERKGKQSVGTTKRGIGPAYTDKASRIGIRAGDLVSGFEAFSEKFRTNITRHGEMYGFLEENPQEFEEYIAKQLEEYRGYSEKLKNMIIDTTEYIRDTRRKGKIILVEGAQGTHLDIDFGTYPFVTSSNTTVAGACSGTGIAPSKVESVIGILKAYTTRVGSGPFPSEDTGEDGEKLRKIGGEYGATTGRPRRCGWLDIAVANYSALVNGVDYWNVTKLDVLSDFPTLKIITGYKYKGKNLKSFPASIDVLSKVEPEILEMSGWQEDISKCRKFEDLPKNAQKYIKKIEELTNTPVKYIGVGMNRDAMIMG